MATQRQKAKAAKLWSLAVIAHMDLVEDDDLANEVREIAISKARAKLESLGFHYSELLCAQDCIDTTTDS